MARSRSTDDYAVREPSIPLRVAAIGEDKRTHRLFFVLSVEAGPGREVEILLPCDVANAEPVVVELLTRAGIVPPVSPKLRREMIAFIDHQVRQSDRLKRVPVVSQTGWCGSSYVTPRRVYGARKPRIHLPPGQGSARQGTKGSLKDWQNGVARLASGNAVPMFGIMVAFAPPLLPLLGFDNCGFQIVAPTSSGKSTCLTAAGSVWGGGGRHGFLENWSTTDNALDATAATHNDCLLVLDDTSLAGGNARDRADLVLSSAYRLENGERKKRLTEPGPTESWNVVFLSSSEHRVTELARMAGREGHLGSQVRMVDICPELDPTTGLFQKLHEEASSRAFADRLKANALTAYGAAADRFLKRLVGEVADQPDELKGWLAAWMDAFRKKVRADTLSGPEARIAGSFALIYAAGRLAGRYGVLQWAPKEMLRAVRQCHAWAAKPSQAVEAAVLDPIAAVRAYIDQNRAAFIDLRRTKRLTAEQLAASPGLIHEHGGGIEYLFPLEPTFRDRVCAGADAKLAIARLRDAGLIRTQRGGKSTIPVKLPGSTERPRMVAIRAAIMEAGAGGDAARK